MDFADLGKVCHAEIVDGVEVFCLGKGVHLVHGRATEVDGAAAKGGKQSLVVGHHKLLVLGGADDHNVVLRDGEAAVSRWHFDGMGVCSAVQGLTDVLFLQNNPVGQQGGAEVH